MIIFLNNKKYTQNFIFNQTRFNSTFKGVMSLIRSKYNIPNTIKTEKLESFIDFKKIYNLVIKKNPKLTNEETAAVLEGLLKEIKTTSLKEGLLPSSNADGLLKELAKTLTRLAQKSDQNHQKFSYNHSFKIQLPLALSLGLGSYQYLKKQDEWSLENYKNVKELINQINKKIKKIQEVDTVRGRSTSTDTNSSQAPLAENSGSSSSSSLSIDSEQTSSIYDRYCDCLRTCHEDSTRNIGFLRTLGSLFKQSKEYSCDLRLEEMRNQLIRIFHLLSEMDRKKEEFDPKKLEKLNYLLEKTTSEYEIGFYDVTIINSFEKSKNQIPNLVDQEIAKINSPQTQAELAPPSEIEGPEVQSNEISISNSEIILKNVSASPLEVKNSIFCLVLEKILKLLSFFF